MKKRKELDALLLNNMNGRKTGKGSSSGKEGHELLRNDASWDSNSTENDELFSPPRRLMIRKPHRWPLCATGIQLCVFVVMVACIVVTGGLVWMHLDLKQDLDELRLRIAKVESELETSTEQASTVSTLQLKIEQLQKLPALINSINIQIDSLNSTSSRLQAKVKVAQDEIHALPTISIEGLQQLTAQIGSTMVGVQGLQSRHTEQLDTLTNSLNQLQKNLTELQGEVANLHRTAPVPTPGSGPSNPTSATRAPSGILDIRTAIHSLQQGQDDVSSAVGKLNTTVASMQDWKQDLMPRITALESADHTGGTPDGSLTEKLMQLQSQVDTLMSIVHSQTPEMETGDQTPSPVASNTPKDWRQEIESEIQAIQKRIDNLNPRDLNNNLLNVNTTRGIQHQIERALSVFKEENLKSVDDLKQEDQTLWGKLYQQHNDIADIQQEVDGLLVRVQDLENKEGETKPPTLSQLPSAGYLSASATTVERPTTADLLQPITIKGISTVEDLAIKFFIMDENSDDLLTYGELQDFLGPDAPHEDQLMRYDKDKDGKLDLAEMKTALGFQ